MANAKKQGELNGLARPTIEALDELCAAHIKAASDLADAKEEAKLAKSSLKDAMEKHRDELEKDSEQQPVYVFQDGDERTAIVLFHEEGIRCRKEKKAGLSVVEGDIG